MAVTIIKKKV